MSLEEMYKQVLSELEQVRQDILASRASGPRAIDIDGEQLQDPIDSAIYSIYTYMDITTPSSLFGACAATDIKKSDMYKYYRRVNKTTANFIDSIINDCSSASEEQINLWLQNIQRSDLMTKVKLNNVVLTTPEQKYFAVNVCKYFIGLVVTKNTIKVQRVYHTENYTDNYTTTLTSCAKDASLSPKEVLEILNSLENLGIVAGQTTYGTISKEEYEQERNKQSIQ